MDFFSKELMNIKHKTHLFTKEKTTKPNSPPWDRSNPILILSSEVSPTRGPITVMMSVLMTIKPSRSDSTFGHSRKRSCRERKPLNIINM